MCPPRDLNLWKIWNTLKAFLDYALEPRIWTTFNHQDTKMATGRKSNYLRISTRARFGKLNGFFIQIMPGEFKSDGGTDADQRYICPLPNFSVGTKKRELSSGHLRETRAVRRTKRVNPTYPISPLQNGGRLLAAHPHKCVVKSILIVLPCNTRPARRQHTGTLSGYHWLCCAGSRNTKITGDFCCPEILFSPA